MRREFLLFDFLIIHEFFEWKVYLLIRSQNIPSLENLLSKAKKLELRLQINKNVNNHSTSLPSIPENFHSKVKEWNCDSKKQKNE